MTQDKKCCGNCGFGRPVHKPLPADPTLICMFADPATRRKLGTAVWEEWWCGSWQPLSWLDLPNGSKEIERNVDSDDFKLGWSACYVAARTVGLDRVHAVNMSDAVKWMDDYGKPAKKPRSRQKPAKAPGSGVAVVPDQPSPKEILEVWDGLYASHISKPYSKPLRGGEARAAAALIKLIGKQDKLWDRIPAAIERFLRDPFYRDKADFCTFASKFSQFDGEVEPKRAGGFLE